MTRARKDMLAQASNCLMNHMKPPTNKREVQNYLEALVYITCTAANRLSTFDSPLPPEMTFDIARIQGAAVSVCETLAEEFHFDLEDEA